MKTVYVASLVAGTFDRRSHCRAEVVRSSKRLRPNAARLEGADMSPRDGWMQPDFKCLAECPKYPGCLCDRQGGHTGMHFAYTGVFTDYEWPREGQPWPKDRYMSVTELKRWIVAAVAISAFLIWRVVHG